MRAITVGTLKRRWAIWAMTMFVLSPSVEATKTSARSIPAAVSASISSAGADRELAAARPPRTCQPDLEPRVRLGVLVEAGDLVALGRASSRATRRADAARLRRSG